MFGLIIMKAEMLFHVIHKNLVLKKCRRWGREKGCCVYKTDKEMVKAIDLFI